MKQNNVEAPVNNMEATTEATANAPAKKPLYKRAAEKIRNGYIRMTSTRGGRIIIRVSKLGALGMSLYGSYKLGQQHPAAKTEVVITTTPVEEPAEEAPSVDEDEATETENMNDEEV